MKWIPAFLIKGLIMDKDFHKSFQETLTKLVEDNTHFEIVCDVVTLEYFPHTKEIVFNSKNGVMIFTDIDKAVKYFFSLYDHKKC